VSERQRATSFSSCATRTSTSCSRRASQRAHQLLTGSERLSLKPARQLPAILERQSRSPTKLSRPHQQTVIRGGNGRLVEHPFGLVDNHSSQRVLVHVHSVVGDEIDLR
jgi:hypothetical protein